MHPPPRELHHDRAPPHIARAIDPDIARGFPTLIRDGPEP
jgi:hypothetical protein